MSTTPQPEVFHCPSCDHQFMTAFAMEVHLRHCRVDAPQPAQGHAPTLLIFTDGQDILRSRTLPEWESVDLIAEECHAATAGNVSVVAISLADILSHAALVASQDALVEALGNLINASVIPNLGKLPAARKAAQQALAKAKGEGA